MHATLKKFGYPATLLWETENWCVLRRPQQLTLGALVLVAKSEAHSFAALPASAYAELQIVSGKIERALREFRPFARINYVMLMMLDPHVHFHVLPRYETSQTFGGATFADAAWPGPPDFKSHTVISEGIAVDLQSELHHHFMHEG
jgi:diadenosine tetraphosphate (Ap4A) HIT family hydrolase